MLKTFINTPENYNAFLRPAIMDSIRAVLRFYRLETSTNVYFNGADNIAKLVGTYAGDGKTADRYTDGIFRNKIFIATEIDRSEFWNNRREATEAPVLDDGGVLPLTLRPSFENKSIKVKVVCMFNSQIDAENLRNQINRSNENMAVNFTFSPITHMVVNSSLVDFFSLLYDMKKKWEPELPEPSEWFGRQWKRPYRVVTDEAGNNSQLVVPIKFQDVAIRLSEPFIAKTTRGSAYGRFEVEFNYDFFLNDFIGWEMEYPLTVWQDEIPAQFITAPQSQHVNRGNWMAAPEIAAMQTFSQYMTAPQVPYYLKLPAHDIWSPPNQFWIMPIIHARFALEDKEEQVLCNIFTDLTQFNWSPVVKEYMLRRRAVAFSHNETPFLIQVFREGRVIPAEDLAMDEAGLITMRGRPDLRDIYRIVISIDYAIRDYSEAFWDDVARNPDVWKQLTRLFPWFDWARCPRPWIHHIDYIRQHIDKGWGGWNRRLNLYECGIELITHNKQDSWP